MKDLYLEDLDGIINPIEIEISLELSGLSVTAALIAEKILLAENSNLPDTLGYYCNPTVSDIIGLLQAYYM